MEWDISAECVSVIMLNIIMVYSWKGNLLPSRKNQAFRACLLITYLSILTNILSTLLLAQLSPSTIPVSYTHLDVYKRQIQTRHSRWDTEAASI